MPALRADMSATSLTLVTSIDTELGSLWKIDSESIRCMGTYKPLPVSGMPPSTDWYWVIQRGLGGTTPTSHSSGATVSGIYPEAGTTSSGGAHTHPESEVTNLPTDLAGKAPSHTHPYEPTGAVTTHASAVDPHPTYLTSAEGTAAYAGTNDARLSDARTPLTHTHAESSVTNLTSDLAAKAAASHAHVEADVANLTTDLAAKATSGHNHDAAYSGTAHTHAESGVTNLVADLAAKAASVHTHAEADVTSLVSDLSSKAATGHVHAPVHANLANGATAMAFGTNTSVKVTPTGNATYTTTVPAAGIHVHLIVLTSGASSFTVTFGTGFKPTTTLATGTTAARVFVLAWVSDGTNLYEESRTIAMVA